MIHVRWNSVVFINWYVCKVYGIFRKLKYLNFSIGLHWRLLFEILGVQHLNWWDFGFCGFIILRDWCDLCWVSSHLYSSAQFLLRTPYVINHYISWCSNIFLNLSWNYSSKIHRKPHLYVWIKSLHFDNRLTLLSWFWIPKVYLESNLLSPQWVKLGCINVYKLLKT